MNNMLVRHMLDLIDRNYAGVITLRSVSTGVGRQPAYLGRLFCHEVGSSFHDYLTRIRMKHAAELIRDGVKIEAVALCVGYRSKKNFYQQFRKQYGTTPVPYRCGTLSHAPAGTRVAVGGAGDRPLPTAMNTGTPANRSVQTSPAVQRSQSRPSDAAPSLRGLSSIFRATNRAWRLAVRAQELLAQNFGRLQMGVLLTDSTGRYVTANRAALDVTGYSSSELRGLSPAELFMQRPSTDTRGVWQFLLTRPGQGRGPNATVRSKTGDSIAVYLVTLRSLLSDQREMAMLDGLGAPAP